MREKFIESTIMQLEYYKLISENAFSQLSEEQLFWQYNSNINSIAILIKHMSGNMLSRWTDFLTTDGEKSWRDRNQEFSNEILTKEMLFERWQQGWSRLFDTLKLLNYEDLEKIVIINKQPICVQDSILKNLSHYAYHAGQIILISKMIRKEVEL